ncbi:MAG: S-layer homology domain-containing protein [Clostridia bacterium]|nr:S-layer homology domain-containing protein [Clostridia bacterium]
MNKNLKKVISTVAALAISASAVSAFAVNFPDVAEDASYAQAVQELSALGVVSGFEDGTFRPDELVTRAQMSKFIVDALAETEQAEASKAVTQFADVAEDHWAKGYINQGVADTFISGYGDGNFGPDDNVTYAQAQSMLVRAIGYQTYAEGSGGWPNGYKTWAASQGITKGIYGLSDDTQLTRAQVAQLVDNTMGAPVCVIKDYETTIDGRRVPNLEIKDDEGKDYQTLFTKKHDAYKVFGRVTKTNKTDNSIDVDKVEFRVEKADNFDDEYIKANSGNEVTDTMYFDDTHAVDYLLTYSEALIQKDDDDEWHIISITPAAATKSVILAAEDYDKVEGQKLYFYPAGTSRNSTGYKVDVTDADFAVYINGVDRTDDYATLEAIGDYIDANDTAAVTLQKQTKIGSTSTTTDYNLVNIISYETAVVKSVTAKTDETIIYFDQYSANIPKSRMTLDLDDDQRTYEFTLDNEVIDPTDLQEDDVLSIAFDPKDFDGSSFYDVIVSRDTVDAAKCTSINADDGEYTFDGTVYKKAAGMENRVKIDMSATYSLYLDHFGRIAKVNEDSVTKKLGILKNVYKKAGGDYYAQVITKEGTEEEYKVDDGNVEKYNAYLKSAVKNLTDGATYNDENKKSVLYPQQVIEYSVSSSSNKITIKENSPLDPTVGSTEGGFAEYKATSEKIGSVKLSDTSVIIDLSDIDTKDDYSVITASSLTDGNDYLAYGYDKSTSGSTFHRFVLITDGTTSFNDETKLAVVRKWNEVDDDDSTKVSYDLAYEGEVQTLVIDEDAVIGGYNDAKDAQAGDVVIFTTNSQGYISKLQKVSNVTLGTDYDGAKASAFAGTLIGTPATKFVNGDWNDLLATSNSKDIDIVAGVIGNSHGNNVTIATPTEDVDVVDTENGTTKTLDFALDYDEPDTEYYYANAEIYTYDFSASAKNGNSRVSVDDGFVETVSNSAFEYDGANGDTHTYLDLTDPDIVDDVVFAIARVDGDDILELYLIYKD